MQTSRDISPVQQSSQTDLQREALRYLKEFGPLRWAALFVRFNEDYSGNIGPALQDLQERKYIDVESDNIAKITAWGMVQLQR